MPISSFTVQLARVKYVLPFVKLSLPLNVTRDAASMTTFGHAESPPPGPVIDAASVSGVVFLNTICDVLSAWTIDVRASTAAMSSSSTSAATPAGIVTTPSVPVQSNAEFAGAEAASMHIAAQKATPVLLATPCSFIVSLLVVVLCRVL